MLPAACLPRRADEIDAVGAALLASADGRGHRRIAVELGRPADTVRGWLRRARTHAPWLRQIGTVAAFEFDPMLDRILPAATPLADAIEVLGQAASACIRRLGSIAPPWQIIGLLTLLTRGRLLAQPGRT